MSINLTYGTTTITLPNPSIPYKEQKVPYQKILDTEGGKRYVIETKPPRKVFELSWNVLNKTNFTQLKGFVENTVNFAANVFTYTDFNNVSYSVRATFFSHSQTSPNHYQVNLKLEEEL